MIRRLLLLGLLLGLAACETVNLSRDYDSSRDFAAYRSWAWAQPAFEYRPDDPRIKSDLTEQRIRSAVAEMIRRFAWCGTSQRTSSAVRSLRRMIVSAASAMPGTAALKTVFPS